MTSLVTAKYDAAFNQVYDPNNTLGSNAYFTPLYAKLLAAKQEAAGVNPFDVAAGQANFTGSITLTTLTVSAMANGFIAVGNFVSGVNVLNDTTILAQLTGAAGGVGTYTVSISQTSASSAMAANSQPPLATVTIPATTASLTNPVEVNYFNTAGGYDSIRVDGIPYKDGTYVSSYIIGGNLVASNASAQISIASMSGPSGGGGFGGMQTGQGQYANTIHRARVSIGAANTNSCAIWHVNGSGLNSNYFPMWVNGVPVAPVSAAVSNGLLQLNFSAPGQYDIAIAAQQSLTVGGVYVDQDDSVIPITRTRLPIILFGDSYVQGVARTPTNTQALGDLTLASAMSWIGGINVIPHGASGTGIVNDGSNNLPATYNSSSFNYGAPTRLAYVAALANASGAPVIVINGSYNDASIVSTTPIAQTQATAILTYLLANTAANIVLTGAFPGNRNNSALTQTVDAGYLAAVNAVNNTRVAFLPVAGAVPPWIVGTKNNSGAGAVAGNSRYYTGGDNTHPSGLLIAPQNTQANTVPNSGIDYIARKILDGIMRVAQARNW